MKGQPRIWSAIEVVTDHAIGSAINTAIRVVAFPLIGIQATAGQHAGLTATFFVIALLRTFGFRRMFNWLMVRRAGVTP